MRTLRWQATHQAVFETGEIWNVMLHEACAYTKIEWDLAEPADIEQQEDHSWTFQGSPFRGRIERLPEVRKDFN